MLYLSLAATSAAGTSVCCAQQKAPQRPNVIFIFADDSGWAELGCYGNTFNETPALDSMARFGVRFTDAYASAPISSRTRRRISSGTSCLRRTSERDITLLTTIAEVM